MQENTRFLIRIQADHNAWLVCRPELKPLRYLDENGAIKAGDSMARIHTMLTGEPSGVVIACDDVETVIRLHD